MAHKILLIDDDVDLVEMNRAYLASKGNEVIFAYNGTDGIATAQEHHPDVIVLDVMMTEVGEGFEVARELKGDPATQNIPILMLTSVNQEHGFNIMVGADESWNPVDEFIEKPFSPQDLLEKINETLK